LEKSIHQNRLLKLAREGQHMTPHDLARFEQKRRYATLVASLLETKTTIIDEVIDMHDRIIGALFNKAKRNHEKLFQQEGKAINDKVRLYYRIGNALMKAKETGTDPFDAIEAIIPWDVFKQTVTEAEKLSTTEDFDYLHRIGDNFSQVRRFSPAFLEAIKLKAAPAAKDLLDAVEIIKELNATNSRTLPNKVPTSFVRKRWKNLVFKENAVDRRFYELCVLA
ncbi:Tn3 family transposase, partial [bacterium]|nr:Tn3 family transposase [bacterium]